MKNTAVLSLTSEPNGRVTGKLCVFFELTLTSFRPADVNVLLRAHAIKELEFMGSKSGVKCSFPLKVRDLIAVLSLVESAAEARFIEELDGEYTVALR